MKPALSIIRPVFWIALLIIGFFIGSSWKSQDSTNIIQSDSAVSPSDQLPAVKSAISNLTPQELATIKIFEDAAPSVAFITTSRFSRDFFTRNITEIPKGTGSGFIWDNKGNIVTNFHVIQGADKATVTLADQSTWEAKLVGVAPEKDLAVLNIEAPIEKLIPIIPGTSDELLVGQSVFAIGNPFGLDQTLTTGVISALGREINSVAGIAIRDVIQSDAAINPGNSGGPLLNSSGQLIGVNTAIFSPSGASAGVGFSIPVNVVRWVVPELITYGKLTRPVLGVELASSRIMAQLNVEGVLVLDVIRGSGAAKSGIQPTRRDNTGKIKLGDIIIALGSEPIRSKSDLFLALEKYKAGEEVKVKVLRDQKEVEIKVVLDEAR